MIWVVYAPVNWRDGKEEIWVRTLAEYAGDSAVAAEAAAIKDCKRYKGLDVERVKVTTLDALSPVEIYNLGVSEGGGDQLYFKESV